MLFGVMAETLERREKIKITGFGNFVVRQKRPSGGRSPQTYGEIVISGRRVVTFKTSKALRKALKGSAANVEPVGCFGQTDDSAGQKLMGLPISL